MSLKSEILPFTTIPSSSTNILSYLTTTTNLSTATAAGNNTTAILISAAVVAAIVVIIMIPLITVSIWCIIIRKRKRTEGMYRYRLTDFHYVKLSTEGTTITDNPAYGQGIQYIN